MGKLVNFGTERGGKWRFKLVVIPRIAERQLILGNGPNIAAAGGTATFKEKTGTSDMNILLPAWKCPMVAYGPGDARYDHTPLERLSLADYARSIAVLKDVLRRAASR